MKKTIYLILTCLVLISCSKSLYTSNYETDKKGISYNLPKNLLKIEVVYTINEPRYIDNGEDKKLIGEFPKITIEDPVSISTVLVADKSKTYLITSNEISNSFFLKSDIDIKLSDNGLLSSIDSEIDDNSIDFAENIVISSAKLAKTLAVPGFHKGSPYLDGQLEATRKEIYDFIIKIQRDIIKIKKKEDLELALKKVDFYKSQIEWSLKNFKTYYKKTKIKYTIIIDPTEKYTKKGISSIIENNKIYHNILPTHIFSEGSKFNDTISIEIPQTKENLFDPLKGKEQVQGIVYRAPSNVNIDITSNKNLLGTTSIYLAQFGKTSVIPVDSKKGGKKKTSLVFSSITGGLVNQKVVAGSSSEKLSKSIKNSVDAVSETIEYLKFEAEIKELTKEKSIKDLKDSLKDPEEVEEESETEFERLLRETTEKQQILELELLIRQIQKQIEDLEEDS
ncbi:DUF4831 family protein [Polaribacter sp. AHE13PA]|jgi:hypothetical protein|uniref:DUF4831 family protein n=1 Tax=Polaribacter sp. AHE13PA TaxID=2745562 RepID=UPI001C4FC916|nr:DUF4831 family protein [Polaribacter sp. AHE13PA]QXP67350.1 DUF4831 family protein [Polaribacter sp. AHE13PA]